MRKRIAALLLSALVLSVLTGCGKHPERHEPLAPTEEPQIAAVTVTPPPGTQSPAPDLPIASVEPGDAELVRAQEYLPDLAVDLRYAGENNFTGTRIYDFDEAWLRYGTVKKLRTAQESLHQQGYGLLIWDAYRPLSAQFRLWEVCPDATFVANPYSGYSSHSNGGTVDITLVTLDGSPVDMPSGFDEFSPLADRDYSDVSQAAAEHARILERAMVDAGFVPYAAEWWHYADSDAYPYEDLEPVRLPASGESRCCPAGERELTLRTAPDLRASALARIPGGTSLRILGFAKGFARVEYLGHQGYVPLDELQNMEP